MLRWCDAVNKHNFIIQHRSGVKQNADALSRMRLTKCDWVDCPDCKGGFAPFADEDDSVLTRHDEELIITPTLTPQPGGVETGKQSLSQVMVMRDRKARRMQLAKLAGVIASKHA